MALRINSMVKFYTLLLVSEHPKHGYELMKELQEKLDRKISPSQVYPFLNLLARKGIIAAAQIGSRDKKAYRLTKQGKAFVNRLLGRFGELIQLSIAPKITTCAHCGCKIYGSTHVQKVGGMQLAFCCKYCAGSFRRN